MSPGTSRTEGRALSNFATLLHGIEAKTVTDKLIFTKSCNYLHIRKTPLLDDVFGNFWSPVNLETKEDKSLH